MVFDNLSIVVQGQVKSNTRLCLLSLRKHAPGAKIILSTWAGSNVSNLEYDFLVLNQDPGADYDCFTENPHKQSKPNNINRQIVSTKSGLDIVKTNYAMKFRTDFVLTSDYIFLFYFDALKTFVERDSEYSIFDERVLVFGVGNVRSMHLAYHVADYVQLGRTDDLKKLWNTDLITQEDANYSRDRNVCHSPHYFNFRLAAEQKIWIDLIIRSNLRLSIPSIYYEINDDIIVDSEKSIINNFIFIDYYAAGINSKFEWMADIDNNFSYKFGDYIRLYKLYFSLNDRVRKFVIKYKLHLNSDFMFFRKNVTRKLNSVRLFRPLFALYRRFNRRVPNELAAKGSNKIFWIDEKGDEVLVDYIPGVDIGFAGANNSVTISTRCLMYNNKIFIDGYNNSICIGKNAHCLLNMDVFVGNGYDDRSLKIGENAMIMGARIFLEEHGNRIQIGDNVTCSDEVLIQSSDGHVIYDDSSVVKNKSIGGISIGNNVWIGRRATILKDVFIPDGCILSAGAIATKKFSNEKCILAGVPAQVIKVNCNWTRDKFNEFNVEFKKG